MCNDNTKNEIEAKIKAKLCEISADEKYSGKVFHARGAYFIVTDGEIREISASGIEPRVSFPDIVTGTKEAEDAFIEDVMKDVGFDDDFFEGVIEYCMGEFDADEADEYFAELAEEGEDVADKADIYYTVKELVEDEDSPFDSMEAFVSALSRRDLCYGALYYEFEGEYYDLYENILFYGEERGEYDFLTPTEWLALLERIDEHIVEPD